MARRCEICQKGPTTGHLVSHSNIKTKTRWLPNVHRMKAVVKGVTRSITACSRCIRTGKVVRPVKRNYNPQASAS